jgi:Gly-Xaa carboxypeptidase
VRLDIVRGAKETPGLEPAPITPSDSESFELIGSTIKKVFGEDVVVAPSAVSRFVLRR